MTRYEELIDEGADVDFVPTAGIENIVSFLADVGHCDFGEHGAIPWSPANLMADYAMLGANLAPNEWREVRKLSALYASAHHEYKDRFDIEPPYGFDAEHNDKANAELARLLKD